MNIHEHFNTHQKKTKTSRIIKKMRRIKKPQLKSIELQIKSSTLRLAKEYMIRITRELRSTETSQAENLFLQGVRFAYRVHQVNQNNSLIQTHCFDND